MSRGRVLRAGVVSVLAAVALPAAIVAAGPAGPAGAAPVTPAKAAAPDGSVTLTSVSNSHPELVSGGDVLVRLAVGAGVDPATVTVARDGEDVTGAFVAQPNGTMLGLVTGLTEGVNEITASGERPADVPATATLTVTNHPLQGPVFSGPRQLPFACQTEESGMGPSSPPECVVPTTVVYKYRTTKGAYRVTTTPGGRLPELAYTTVNGRQVPWIVRIEQGVVNRSIYQFVVLWDGADPSPTRTNTSWNGRLVYNFGGGCHVGFQQGVLDSTGTGPTNDSLLRLGYGIAYSTLNRSSYNCAAILGAENVMMTKEKFIEVNGPVSHTIGWGGSGSTIQEMGIADTYPGLLDGLVPNQTFPNAVGNLLEVIGDCRLLNKYFGQKTDADGSRKGFTAAQQNAIYGHVDTATCSTLDRLQGGNLEPTKQCRTVVPVALQWNATTNPNGVTCSLDTQSVVQLGENPDTGLPNSPIDNVGVQYGLNALLAKTITPLQFINLNKSIGGINNLGVQAPARGVASDEALTAMYRDNIIMTGALNLRSVPIIDLRVYVDDEGSGHTFEWSFVIRQRLADAGGSANSVIAIVPDRDDAVTTWAATNMSAWLDAIAADGSAASRPDKVAADKPADLGDGCYQNGVYTREDLTYRGGTGYCAQTYPAPANPRLAAGQPLSMTQMKCRLKPLVKSDYPGVTFTPPQWNTLTTVFPNGVCDWSQPGVGQAAPSGTWPVYGDGS